MPGASWLDVLRETKQADATIPVILLTAFGSVEEAVTAMKEGAFDFLQKPVDLDHLKLLVQRAARQQELLRENLILREEYAARYGFPRIVGEHASIREVSQQIQRVATTDSTVLLLGESGTGKELFARAIHHLSARREQPLVALNCAAIPEGLVENELFGHERGAFTGAGARKVGKLDLAHRGTLFLDEIGELPLAIQAKLLRVLEEKRFDRVGGTQPIEVDVRIVVATNRNLQKLIEEKLFREDLYFRIAAVPMTIPPLRERGKDVLLLANHFLEKFSREFAKPGLELSGEAGERLLHYPWPGNVRELQNTLERAVILADGLSIDAASLQLPVARPDAEHLPGGMVPENFNWEGSLEEVTGRAIGHIERVLLENTLRESKWNKTRAAEKLGVTPKTLLAKLRNAGLEE
jgi:DNA-binding NtrC family response regulator